MLIPATKLAPGVRCTRAVGLRIPSGLATAALIRHRQQTRAFRFGLWSSYLDPEFHHEIRRRQRKLKSKFAESLNRRLSWDKNPYVEELKAERRRAATDYWYSRHHCHHHGRYAARSAPQRTPDNPTGERPGRNIEDAERGPMEHLLFGDRAKRDSYIYDHWSSPLQNIRDFMAEQRDQIMKPWTSEASAASSAESTSGTSMKADRDVRQDNTESDYVIDPITNRKVSKSTSPLPKSTLQEAPLEIPVKTFKGHTHQFTPSQPASAKTVKKTEMNAKLKETNNSQHSEARPATKTVNKETRVVDEENNDYVRNHIYNHAANISTIFGDNFVTWKYKGLFWQKEDKSPAGTAEATQKPGAAEDGPSTASKNARTTRAPPLPEKKIQLDSVRGKEAILASPSTRQHDEATAIKPESQKGTLKGEHAEGEGMDAEELAKYQPFRHLDSDAASPAATKEDPIPDDLSKYRAVKYHELDGKEVEAEDFPQSPGELDKYQAFRYLEPDGLPPLTTENGDIDPTELRMYDNQAGVDKPNGKQPSGADEQSSEAQALENLRASDIRAAVGQSQSENTPRKSNYRKIIESLMPSYHQASEESVQESKTTVTSGTDQGVTGEGAETPDAKEWTGNYARDFPEDFQRTWSTENSASKATLFPDSIETPSQTQPSLRASIKANEGGARLQPALDRQHSPGKSEGSRSVQAQAGGDGYSQKPQGSETSYKDERAGEKRQATFFEAYGDPQKSKAQSDAADQKAHDRKLVQEIKQIYEDAYGAIETNKAQTETSATTSSSPPSSDPTVYKILAYDPTMQAINIAETTSIVNDGANPLTPAEVLLRLSNPAKFFPHFAPLRAEGYEIVSGSGDVLVFRKVREAVPQASETASATTATKTAGGDEKSAPEATQQTSTPSNTTSGRVNPIDLTGRTQFHPPPSNPAWNFASPTGYVNYDLPPLERPAPPFRSNIDVRREEPVFSGRKTGGEDGTKQRRSIGKRMLVGAAWVAGVSYALGVVGEYFKTGGVDGMGPKGL